MFHLTTKNNTTITCNFYDIFYFIKGSILYLSFNIESNINFTNEDKSEMLQLIKCLQTYCILYCTEQLREIQNKVEEEVKDNNQLVSSTSISTQNVLNHYSTIVPIIVDVPDNELIEFWATFTSCWHIFVKYNLDGLYLLLITFRTFDSEKITISKEITEVVYKSLLSVYPYNKEELTSLIEFFHSAVRTKSGIESDTISQSKYLL
jgi:hypothetical protein